ncbi:acyl-CoA dehydratase activase [Natranaerobius thermophilus]|uniref:CoA-substrate-specific enzyme activase n=1 Tax=Natranaerobius thermophilus (strain ATCC BAA-1301 / DSM 18059 / JW/NM-WN-LF) TaxID=457570 RepID=B2A5J0_NATTJ|nr:acyl-CoA dehydratase activase [Natranaerobius thermophilus]ACB85345.1 CoA-substrate-specific enzyme activase [Natranaerobius thermophilus JW/NM-WN-LF]
MSIAAGIDIGSLSTEVVIVQNNQITSQVISATGSNSKKASEESFNKALDKAGVQKEEVGYIVSTGYGRVATPFADKQITEITCHAKGMYYLNPDMRTVIDIGGQDSKAIKLAPDGTVEDFIMNDKCAAGTGRFLEVMASALEVELEEFVDIGKRQGEQVPVTSMCTVFAESEVVSLIGQGYAKEKIIRGLIDSIGERTETMADRVQIEPPIAMSGGVAKNKAVVTALENRSGENIFVPKEPQTVGALGAALLAEQFIAKSRAN